MLKPLSYEGLFECGALDLVKGKAAAFTAAIHSGGMGLGLAVANQPGYYPVPLAWCHGDDWNELRKHADALNLEHFDLDAKAASTIVASSIAAQNRRNADMEWR